MSSSTQATASPSEIRYTEVPEGEWGTLPTLHMSDNEKFVYFKNGNETSDLKNADEVVPVVSIEILFVNKENAPCPKANAIKTIVSEFGPEGRFLRKKIKDIQK